MTFDQLTGFVSGHVVEVGGGYLLFNAVAGAMPPAGPDSSVAYKWLHGTMQTLAVNVRSLMAIWHPKALEVPGFAKDAEQKALSASAGKE